MKTSFVVGLILITILSLIMVFPMDGEAIKRVAVLYFDDHSGFDSPTGCGCLPVGPFGFLFGQGRHRKWNLKMGFRDMLNEKLTESQHYEVIYPDDLAIAFAELEMSKRDVKNEAKRAELADKLNLDAMLIGDVRRFNQERLRGSAARMIREGGKRAAGVGGIQAAGYYYRATVHLKIKMYDATGREIAISKVNKSAVYELGGVSAAPFRAVTTNRGTEFKMGTSKISTKKGPDPIVSSDKLDKIEFNSPEFRQTLFWAATEKVLNGVILKLRQRIGPELTAEEISESTSQPTPTVTPKGMIASVKTEPPQAYITLGSEQGIAVGDKLVVYTQGAEITDPQTGQVLGYEEEKAGLIEIIDVMSPSLSKAQILEGVNKLKRGDIVKK